MGSVTAIAWSVLLAGALLAAALGRWSRSGIARAGVGIGVGALGFIVMNAALADCVARQLCPALGDEGVTYVLHPVAAAPVYWAIAAIAGRKK